MAKRILKYQNILLAKKLFYKQILKTFGCTESIVLSVLNIKKVKKPKVSYTFDIFCIVCK